MLPCPKQTVKQRWPVEVNTTLLPFYLIFQIFAGYQLVINISVSKNKQWTFYVAKHVDFNSLTFSKKNSNGCLVEILCKNGTFHRWLNASVETKIRNRKIISYFVWNTVLTSSSLSRAILPRFNKFSPNVLEYEH